MACKFCGPKLSLCGLVLSVWGIIQLTLMGVFYYIKAVALLEDLPPEVPDPNVPQTIDNFIAHVEHGYHQNALNCWIAALLYLITLVVSGHQFWMNNRSSSCGILCMVLSFWAVVQLVLMGIFFKMEVLGLIHSVVPHEYEDIQDFIKITKNNYNIVATNCFIAAAMYVVMIGVSYVCIRKARKADTLRAQMLEDDELSCTPVEKKFKSKQKQK